jgi:FMN phosphatase YigB (HAD superfamily)
MYYRARAGAAELFAALNAAHNAHGAIEKQIPFAVYSDYPLVKERLDAIGLSVPHDCEVRFPKVYCPDDFGAQKPAPAPFLRIAKDLGCEPNAVLVAGDRDDTDGKGAEAAGMRYFSVKNDSEWKTFCAQLLENVKA